MSSGEWQPSKRQFRVKEEAADALDWKKFRKEGYMTKLGGGKSTFGRRSWKKRHFVLADG